MEPLNQSAAAVSGSFAPTCRFENFEIRKGFLQFSNLNLETKSLADRSFDWIRASQAKITCNVMSSDSRQLLQAAAGSFLGMKTEN